MAWSPDYLEVEQLAEYVNITDSDDDALLAPAIAAASRAIDQNTHRQFGLVAAPEERRYTARWSPRRGRWVVQVDDFQTVTGLAVNLDLDDDGTFSDAVTGFTKLPLNAAVEGRPWEQLVLLADTSLCGAEGEVAVTARYGWTAFPEVVVQACYLQASRFYERRKAPFGVAGSPDAGSEMRLLAKVDPDVAVMLLPVTRRKWGVG
jgi:hypothetical protein